MSALTNVLRQITNKTTHPNALLHQIQLERAKNKYLVQGQLGHGVESVVALTAPEKAEAVKAEIVNLSKEEVGDEDGKLKAVDGEVDGDGKEGSGKE